MYFKKTGRHLQRIAKMTKGNKRGAKELHTQSLKTKKQNGLFPLISSNLVSNIENTKGIQKTGQFYHSGLNKGGVSFGEKHCLKIC